MSLTQDRETLPESLRVDWPIHERCRVAADDLYDRDEIGAGLRALGGGDRPSAAIDVLSRFGGKGDKNSWVPAFVGRGFEVFAGKGSERDAVVSRFGPGFQGFGDDRSLRESRGRSSSSARGKRRRWNRWSNRRRLEVCRWRGLYRRGRSASSVRISRDRRVCFSLWASAMRKPLPNIDACFAPRSGSTAAVKLTRRVMPSSMPFRGRTMRSPA